MDEIEYSVEERNEYAEPSVIEQRIAQPPSYLRYQYLRSMPKKRRVEEFLLKQRDQARLKQLFDLPQLLEEARRQRVEQGKALQQALAKVSSLPDEPEEKEAVSPSPLQAGSTTVSSPQQMTQAPVKFVLKRARSDNELWIWIILTVFFFAMSYYHDAREFVKRKIILDLIIDSIVPPLFDMVCTIEQSCMDFAPVPTKIILVLYYCWKFWVSVGALCYLYCKFQEGCGVCTLSVDALWRRCVGLVVKFVSKYR